MRFTALSAAAHDPLAIHAREMAELAVKHEPFKVAVPEGESGDWKVDRFYVGNDPLMQMRCWRDGRPVPDGWYTRLAKRGTGLFMTDTPAELNDARELFQCAFGHVLITGLGLGMIPKALLPLADFPIDKITIVELEPDVIKLVAGTLTDPRIEVVQGNAFDWTPPKGVRFDWAWHDIWPLIDDEARAEWAILRKHYAPFMDQDDAQLCWGEAE